MVRFPLPPADAEDLVWFLDLAVAQRLGADYRTLIQRIARGDEVIVTLRTEAEISAVFAKLRADLAALKPNIATRQKDCSR